MEESGNGGRRSSNEWKSISGKFAPTQEVIAGRSSRLNEASTVWTLTRRRRGGFGRAPVIFERHLQVPVDVQVVPVEARHALRVAEVGHSQDEVARQRLSSAEPLPGERELVQRAATASRPRAMPASNPAK